VPLGHVGFDETRLALDPEPGVHGHDAADAETHARRQLADQSHRRLSPAPDA